MKIVEIRDGLTNIINLITVCHYALRAEKDLGPISVADTLHFDVIKQLRILDEKLKQIEEK